MEFTYRNFIINNSSIPSWMVKQYLLKISYISKGFRRSIITLYNNQYYGYLRFKFILCPNEEYDRCGSWINLKQYLDIFSPDLFLKKR
jgi:hypothetical protein